MIAPRRSGYTLLEVLLATAIGVLLLAAVYVAVDVQFSSAQSGRDMVEQSTLARSLLTRMGEDINLSLGTVDPSRYRSSRGQSGGSSSGQTGSTSSSGTTGSTGATTNTNTGTTNTSTTNTTNSTQSSESGSTTQSSTAQNGVVTFNLFVQGTADSLTLYVSRYPREYTVNPADPESLNAQLILSDLRRITYWLAGGVDSPLGLAKQELKIATSEDATSSLPLAVDDEASFVIAEEVRSLKFSYFDGTDWLEEWYGDVLVNKLPKGPPLAIAIEMEVAPPGSVNKPNREVLLRKFRHVVAIPVANGVSQQATQQATEQQMSTTTP